MLTDFVVALFEAALQEQATAPVVGIIHGVLGPWDSLLELLR